MPGQHALLSPSAAHRWMHCTASPKLEATQPETTSVYAEEGTLAHEICECKLLFSGFPESYKWAERPDDIYINEHGASWEEHPLYNPEMEGYTDEYVDIILDRLKDARKTCPDATLWVEEKIDLTDFIPEGFGTSDAGIIADGFMEVFDFKYGKGVAVSAIDNPQMKVYALGAYKRFEAEYEVDKIKMTIIQPRIGNLSSGETSSNALLSWGFKELAVKARIAFDGKNTTQEAGEWCKFCAVKRQCRALAEYSTNACKKTDTDARLLTIDEIGELLEKIPTIETWIAGVKDYALEASLSGTKVPGFKVVEGRSIRKISNHMELSSRLVTAGFEEKIIYKPKELQTISTLEKLVGKKRFSELAEGCIEKPAGKPTLAPETDKRPEYSKPNSDFADLIS